MSGNGTGPCSARGATRRLAGACALGALLAATFASAPAHAKFHIVAHRGGTVTRPENTLVNFAHAIEIGVHWSETDSWLSKDGVPVLHHDIDMCRTTTIGTFPGYDCSPGGAANNPLLRYPWIRDFTVAELELLDVGSWFSPTYAGERMPTLEEALQLVNGTGMPLLVEMKVPGQALKIRQILIDNGIGAENMVAWARAGEGIAAEFRTHLPEVRRMIGLMDPRTITEADLAYWSAQGDFGICVQSPWLTQEFVDLAHSYGLVLYSVPAPTSWMPTLQQVDIGVDYFHTGDADGGVALAASLHCSDGLDNDGDALVDFPDDPGCTKRSDTSEVGQCQDGLDNDGDGEVDLADPGCSSASDDDESSAPPPACSDGLDNDGDTLVDFPADPGCAVPTSSNESPQCNDGLDNDGDALFDLADPDCTSASDDDESPPPPACSDGLDNDGDTLVDFPADPGCVDAASSSESPQCNDGLDNDGDAFIDLADGNCASASDDDESPPTPECNDGLDNDGDGKIDYGAGPSNDPGCQNELWFAKESPQCQNGIDDDGDTAVDWPADASCQAPWDDDEATSPPPSACGLLGIEPIVLAALASRRRLTRRGAF